MTLCVALSVLLAAVLLAQPASEKASALIDVGVELSNRGRFNEAGEKFVQALAIDPGSAEAHYLLGLVRQQSGRVDAALNSFRSAVRIHPRYAAAQSRICELTTGSAKARETGYDRAKAECRRAIALEPKDPEPHFHLGWNEAQLGNRPESIAEYQTVLKLDPKFRQAKLELATAYLDSQQTALAIPLLRDVIEADPANGAAKYQLGAALAKQGDCQSAIPLLETATPTSQSLYVLANCYKKLGRDADAQATLARVKNLREGSTDRGQARYRASVAHKHSEAGQFDEAIAEYRASLALQDDLTVRIDLAVALLKKGQAEEVVKMFATEKDPLARYQLAVAQFQLRRLNDAAATLQALLTDRPQFVEAWYQLGLTLLDLGKPSEAANALGKATQLRPDEPAIRLAWAETLERSGHSSEARQQRAIAGK